MVLKINKKIIILAVILIILALLVQLKLPSEILKILYPTKYEGIVEQNANEYGVDKYLIYAIIKAESNFNENAKSSKGAKGLMQLMESTASYIVKNGKTGDLADSMEFDERQSVDEKILTPECNIKLGTKYISNLISKYNCIELALVAYNAGSGNVDSWIKQGILKEDGSNVEVVPYKETNNYVRKILRDYDIYKELYG